MKILFFSRDYTNHDHRWLQALSDAGHEVRFLRLERSGSNHDQRAFPPGVSEIDWVGGKKPFSWTQVEELQAALELILDQESPDLLHAGPLNTASVLAARSGFHPLVQMSWGSDILRFAQEDENEKLLVLEALGSADTLIGDCDAVRQAATKMGMRENAIVTFPWGIDLQRFSRGKSDSLRESLGWQNKFVLLHTRNLDREYGVESIAKGFAQAAMQAENLRLILVGDGSFRDELKEYFAKENLVDRVHFSGQISQAQQPEYFQNADLYLSGTYSDGSSVSLMEALGSGLPALLSDIAGNREWVQEGKQGWLFPTGDSEALARKMIAASKLSLSELNEIGNASRKIAERRADWQKNQLMIQDAYQIALGLETGVHQ